MKRYTNNITAIVAVSEYGKIPNDSRIALGTTLPFEEVKDQVYQTYLMVKRQEKYLEKLNEISKDAEVKKYY